MKKEIKQLMKKYNLTVKDLPAFPPKTADLKKMIIAIGEVKKNPTNKLEDLEIEHQKELRITLKEELTTLLGEVATLWEEPANKEEETYMNAIEDVMEIINNKIKKL